MPTYDIEFSHSLGGIPAGRYHVVPAADWPQLERDAALGRAVREAIGDSPMLPQILLQHANGAHWFVHDILVTIANWYEQHP